jgi:hypothetical protein
VQIQRCIRADRQQCHADKTASNGRQVANTVELRHFHCTPLNCENSHSFKCISDITAHEDHDQSQEQAISPPVLRKACVKLLEPKLGDVVSGDLWRLVNKLCETAMSNYYAAA